MGVVKVSFGIYRTGTSHGYPVREWMVALSWIQNMVTECTFDQIPNEMITPFSDRIYAVNLPSDIT